MLPISGIRIDALPDMRRTSPSSVAAVARAIGISLVGANLSRANLQGANLTGVMVAKANLGAADFEEARADEKTVWPKGFDPKFAGVTFD